LILVLFNILYSISIIIAAPKIFSTYYYIDYRTIPIKVIYRFYQSPPYQNTANIFLISTESVIPTLLDLSDPPTSLLYTRLLYRLFIIISNTIIITHPLTFRLAGSQIRRTVFPRRRD
jgi:hypothetical protein